MSKIPEYLRKILDHPLRMAEIKRKFGTDRRKSISRDVRELVKSGEIVKTRGGRYGLADQMNLITGQVHGHPDGFGFIIPEEEGEKDVYIGPKNFREAMHGDRVICRVEKVSRDGKVGGRVIRILERAHKKITGQFESRGIGGIIVPSQRRITQDFHVPAKNAFKAKSGQIVTAEITTYPSEHQTPQAEITDVLGYPGDPKVDKLIIIRQYDLPEKFPVNATKQAVKIKEPSKNDFKSRLDLRNDWIITIDGETAKDFDDAVSIKKLPQGYKLGVHIADVSHYVHPKTALDRAAFDRGNSTYFPGSVIPMLPFELSNEICSLKPHVDRLTMSAIMEFTRAGKFVKAHFARSVINSKHRMTYTEAARIIEEPEKERDAEKAKNLKLMKTLCDKINACRIANGSLEFDLPEPEFVLDIQGEPKDIIRAERNCAHRLIEEFMLSANRATAAFLEERPSLYRIHPEPDAMELETFFDFAGRIGYKRPKKKTVSLALQEILQQARGKQEEKLLNFIMLRAMKKASYSPDNIGHFGLAFADYTHFTSPIRRYPDLLVHRAIKEKLAKLEPSTNIEKLHEVGRHCLQREILSESAERDVVDSLKVRFMADHEGSEFEGIISGVTAFGIFVELTEIFVEGLIRLTDLHDDYYQFNEQEYEITGKRKGKRYRLGTPIKIRITSVDVLKREINMAPADMPRTSYPVRHKKIKRRTRRRNR